MTPPRLPCVVRGQREDGAWEIGLTRGLVALVDEADLAAVIAVGKWYADPNGRTFYARHGARSRAVKMHTFLTGWPLVDHINGDGLDNRRSNLREASQTQNKQNARVPVTNTSGFKGVSWNKSKRKWEAYIRFEGRQVRLGTFAAAQEAAEAYDSAAIAFRGEFAWTNFEQAS